MKKILIVMGNHSPNPSSVANCVDPLIIKLVNQGHYVDVITDKKDIKTLDEEIINNVNVYRVKNNYRVINSYLDNFNAVINKWKVLKPIFNLPLKLARGLVLLKYRFNFIERQSIGWSEKKVVAKCLELYNQKKYDTVISISQPFISHHIASKFYKLINGKIKWIVFQFDPFTYNNQVTKYISRRKKKRAYRNEDQVLDACDQIFLTPELYDFYIKKPYKVYKEKFKVFPFANLSPISYKESVDRKISFNKNKINCIFTGRFYKDIRNPEYALNILNQVDNNIHFTFLTNYKEETIRSLVLDVSNKFSVHPLQDHDISKNALLTADILINIGNTVSFQVPGKIFEYMSTGKPIIHFSKTPEDPSLKYLKKYPFVLIIKEWLQNYEEDENSIRNFCEEFKDSKLDYLDVATIFKEIEGDNVSARFVATVSEL
ncbi:glycosyltransferase family 4 protein [Halobacillus faecis]|uniref:Glycosyltransferase subfamily 4-like N-terminal domain-containing protein n=1 Tax=Halobacillus faecis TaxID=360184 RepID=A0A511WU00_9BACI|nr:glycosyltransferase family 4 protein [Halobacillus faecis]GEN54615.1 hypothetical protein HFA01_28770 [Halobacillus faecis]